MSFNFKFFICHKYNSQITNAVICYCNFIFGLLRILLGLFLVLFGFSLCYLGFFVLFGCLLCVVNVVILDCLGCLL